MSKSRHPIPPLGTRHPPPTQPRGYLAPARSPRGGGLQKRSDGSNRTKLKIKIKGTCPPPWLSDCLIIDLTGTCPPLMGKWLSYNRLERGRDCHFTTRKHHHDRILFPVLLHNSGHVSRRRDQIWSRIIDRVTKPGHGYIKCHHVRITSEINTLENSLYYPKIPKITPFRLTSWPRFPDFSRKPKGRFQNQNIGN